MTLTSKELKRRARASLEGNYFVATSLATSLYLFSFAMTFILHNSGFGASKKPLYQAFYWLLWAIMLLLNALLEVGFIRYLYGLCKRDTQRRLNPLFYGFQNQPDSFILACGFRYLVTLIWFVPALLLYFRIPITTEPSDLPKALLPALLLALIGLIPALLLALPYGLSTFVLLDDPYCTALEALRKSRYLMKGNKLRLLRLWLSFLPICLLGFGSYGIGFFWIRPYYHASISQFYLSLTGQLPAGPDEAVEVFIQM